MTDSPLAVAIALPGLSIRVGCPGFEAIGPFVPSPQSPQPTENQGIQDFKKIFHKGLDKFKNYVKVIKVKKQTAQ